MKNLLYIGMLVFLGLYIHVLITGPGKWLGMEAGAFASAYHNAVDTSCSQHEGN